MKYLVILNFLLSPYALAGEDHYKPKPKSPEPVVQPQVQPPAQPQGDSVHHESRSSKLAKIAGVLALIGITYHLTWGGKPDQNKGKITFEPRKE